MDVIDQANSFIHYTDFITGPWRAFGAWNPWDSVNRFRGHFDYRAQDLTFQISSYSGRLEASEFGNYLAGYTLYYNYGIAGEIAARAGGQLYGLSSTAGGYNEWYGLGNKGFLFEDWGSMFWITKGALDANRRAQEWYKNRWRPDNWGMEPLKPTGYGGAIGDYGEGVERGFLKLDESRLTYFSQLFDAFWFCDYYANY